MKFHQGRTECLIIVEADFPFWKQNIGAVWFDRQSLADVSYILEYFLSTSRELLGCMIKYYKGIATHIEQGSKYFGEK